MRENPHSYSSRLDETEIHLCAIFVFTNVSLCHWRDCTSDKIARWCSLMALKPPKCLCVYNDCLKKLLSYGIMYHQMQIYLQQEIKWPLGLICHLFSCSGVCTLPLKWGLNKVWRARPLSRGISSSACQLRARLHLLIRIYFSLLLLTLFALKVKVKERFTSTKYQQNIC